MWTDWTFKDLCVPRRIGPIGCESKERNRRFRSTHHRPLAVPAK
jgi:hypothetical protein